MTAQSENTKRIAKNTLMLYIRMLFVMAVSMFTTRVVVDILGAEDYGLNNLVGGIVGMMGIVTSLLSQGTSRFITIALGSGNEKELRNTFAASLTIHLALAILILILGEIIGPILVSRLNISPDRMGTAQFVFQLSLIGSIIGILQTPYHAAIIAHEKMEVYAYISIWDIVVKLLIVYLLLVVDIDKLKLYAIFYFIVGILSELMYLYYCRTRFAECKNWRYTIDFKLCKDIFNYTGWNALGACAFTMNSQGITILLSVFGTAVNAARGLAGSVANIAYRFVDGFQTAARPQITKFCAVGDYAAMNNLIVRTSKFSSYLMGIIGIPLYIEMEFFLDIWLKEVPDYTVIFTRLTLVQFLIQSMDFPIGSGIHAVGKMKLPNMTSAFIYMAILPISYIAIQLGASPEITYILTICIYPLAMFMDLYIINKYTGFNVWQFLTGVVLKSVVFIIFTAIVSYYIADNVTQNVIWRVIVTTLTSTITFIPLVYIFGLTQGERNYIVSTLKKKLHLNYE